MLAEQGRLQVAEGKLKLTGPAGSSVSTQGSLLSDAIKGEPLSCPVCELSGGGSGRQSPGRGPQGEPTGSPGRPLHPGPGPQSKAEPSRPGPLFPAACGVRHAGLSSGHLGLSLVHTRYGVTLRELQLPQPQSPDLPSTDLSSRGSERSQFLWRARCWLASALFPQLVAPGLGTESHRGAGRLEGSPVTTCLRQTCLGHLDTMEPMVLPFLVLCFRVSWGRWPV